MFALRHVSWEKVKMETFTGSCIRSAKSEDPVTTRMLAVEDDIIKKSTSKRPSALYPAYISGWWRREVSKLSELRA